MPELYLDIKLTLDESSKKTVQAEIQEIQDAANKAAKGGTEAAQKQTKAIQAQSNAQKELNDKFIRLVNLNEIRFRQDKISQENALKNAQLLEKAAINQGILTDNTKKGVAMQKTMQLSQQRIATGFTGMAATSARANQSLMNLGRIVQDLPFGFLGISNNIDPALNSFRALKEEAGGTMGALRLLGKSLIGSGGLVFMLGSVLPTAVLIATQGFNMYRKRTDEAKDSTSKLTDSVRSFIDESARIRSSGSFLDINSIQRRIEAIDRLDFAVNSIKEGIEEVNKANEIYARVSADVTSFQSEYKKQLDATKLALEEIEKRYGVNAEQLEIIKDRQKELNDELAISRALLKADPTAQFRQGIEKTSEEFIFLAESGLIAERRLREQADAYRLQMQQLHPLINTNEDARIKYIALKEAIDKLEDSYKSITGEIPKATFETDLQAQAEERLAESFKKSNEERKRKLEFQRKTQKLIANLPKREREDFGPESRALARRALVEQLQSDRQISQAEGLVQKKLEIERNFQQRVIDLGKQGLLNKGVLNELELTKYQQLEKAKTDFAEEQNKRRVEIQKQLLDTFFSGANNIFSSIGQLQSASYEAERVRIENMKTFTEEQEKQKQERLEQLARKKFETEKKLQLANAIMYAASGIASAFTPYIPTVSEARAAIVAAATGIQIAAIKAQKFDDSSFNANTGGSGFFETDVPERDRKHPMRPESSPTVNISLEGEFDDEMVSVKAERGKDKRLRGTQFTV